MFQFVISLLPGVLYLSMGALTLAGEAAAHRGCGRVREGVALMMGSLKVSGATIGAVLCLLMAFRIDTNNFFDHVLSATVFCFFALSGVVDLAQRRHRSGMPLWAAHATVAAAVVAHLLALLATEDSGPVVLALLAVDAAAAALLAGRALAPGRPGVAALGGACLVLDGTVNLHASILEHHHAHAPRNPAHLSWLAAQFLWHFLAATLVLLAASFHPRPHPAGESLRALGTPKLRSDSRLRRVRRENPFGSFLNASGGAGVVVGSNPLYQALPTNAGAVEHV